MGILDLQTQTFEKADVFQFIHVAQSYVQIYKHNKMISRAQKYHDIYIFQNCGMIEQTKVGNTAKIVLREEG